MASLPNDEETQATGGSNPVTTPVSTTTTAGSGTSGGASGGTGTATSSTATAPAGSPTAAPTTTSANEPDVSQIANLNQNVDFTPLLNYVGGQGTTATNALNTANSAFNTALGTFAPFGASNQSTLNDVLAGNQPLSVGQSLLNNTYSGPSGIDLTQATPLINNYVQDAGETQNQNGIETLLGQVDPSLTQGDKNYDSLVYGQNPGYQTQSQAMMNDANNLNTTAGTDQTTDAAAVAQRQSDINAFNTAAKGYVQSQSDNIMGEVNQQEQSAQQQDNSLQSDIPALENGSMGFSSLQPNELAFDPNAYQPTQLTSQYGANVFNEAVNPLAYLNYQYGTLPDQNNVATQPEATQYNNAQTLLNEYGQIDPSSRQGAELSVNQQAFQQALQLAQQQENIANAEYLASQQPPPGAPAPVPDNSVGNGGAEGGGADIGGDAGTDAGASDGGAPSDAGGAGSGADDGEGASGAGADAGGDGSSGDGSDAGGGGSSGDGGDGFSKGGLVTNKPTPALNFKPAASPFDIAGPSPTGYARGGLINSKRTLHPGGTRADVYAQPPANPLLVALAQSQTAPSAPVTTPAAPAAQAAAATPLNFQKGGYIPPGTSPNPNIRDDIPAHVDDGEFVVKRPSTNAAGIGNMAAINQLGNMPPAQQAMARNAIHAALSRVIGGAR